MEYLENGVTDRKNGTSSMFVSSMRLCRYLNRMNNASSKMTFIGHQGASVIDHVLCDRRALEYVCDYKVHDVNILSDHCVLTFSVSTGRSNKEGEGSREGAERRMGG